MNHFNESPYKIVDGFSLFLKMKEKAELRKLLQMELVSEIIKQGGLRLFGRAERKDDDDWVKRGMAMEVDGTSDRGRARKTWLECIEDIQSIGPTVRE